MGKHTISIHHSMMGLKAAATVSVVLVLSVAAYSPDTDDPDVCVCGTGTTTDGDGQCVRVCATCGDGTTVQTDANGFQECVASDPVVAASTTCSDTSAPFWIPANAIGTLGPFGPFEDVHPANLARDGYNPKAQCEIGNENSNDPACVRTIVSTTLECNGQYLLCAQRSGNGPCPVRIDRPVLGMGALWDKGTNLTGTIPENIDEMLPPLSRLELQTNPCLVGTVPQGIVDMATNDGTEVHLTETGVDTTDFEAKAASVDPAKGGSISCPTEQW